MQKSAVLLFILALIACKDEDTKVPSYEGIISFNANLSSSEPIIDYVSEFQAIFKAGARGVQLAAP